MYFQEFVLIPILLAYPALACLGGFGGSAVCCQPQQQGCAGPICSPGGFGGPSAACCQPQQPGCTGPICTPGGFGGFGGACCQPQQPGCTGPTCAGVQTIGGGRGGYVAPPTFPGGIGGFPSGPDYRPASYVAPPLNAPVPQVPPQSQSSYNAPQAAPPPQSSYNAPQAAPAPAQPYAPQLAYGGPLKAPSLSQPYKYKDSTLGGTQSLLLPPENPPVPGRFAEGIEQATLPDDDTINFAGISSASSSIDEKVPVGSGTQEVAQTHKSTTQPEAVSIRRQSIKRFWRY
ncbi:hypothetical protein LOAG_12218 [Loa loa]|uniref:Uncharacterized protein n=1 Tax=Loa loa TaxID=7209 RepID=A0A1I7W3J3_LOALO|nr:hypothetical protein LOAG_12218 [Loa loa]EFO16289.1 hypothetical protein LOAG_12218 [Loa loa]